MSSYPEYPAFVGYSFAIMTSGRNSLVVTLVSDEKGSAEELHETVVPVRNSKHDKTEICARNGFSALAGPDGSPNRCVTGA